MINHPLTILQRMPAFAKPGLIHRNPPVQVGEGTCQVQQRQPVLIRYQIREVSGSRRTGATLLFLADPKSLPTSSSPKTKPPPCLTSSPRSLPSSSSAATHSKNHQRFPARSRGRGGSGSRGEPLIFCQLRAL